MLEKGKSRLFILFCLVIIIIPTSIGIYYYSSLYRLKEAPLKVGILYATSGPQAPLEQPIVDSLLLAIEEINRKGGVLGKTLQPIVIDTMSQQIRYEQEAERLINYHKVSVIFGCLESGSRKLVKKVVERNNNLLIYPGVYEGIETSSNIIYTGMIPNQFVLPGLLWSFNHIGQSFYLLGTSSLLSVIINKIAKTYIQHLGGSVVKETIVPLGHKNFETIIKEIQDANPAIIVNTLETESNAIFFKKLYESNQVLPTGVKHIPTMAFNLYEDEIETIGKQYLAGHYTAWSYYSNLNSEKNRAFISELSKKFGTRKITGDLVEAAYTGVHIWSQAVTFAHSTDPGAIKRVLSDISFNAPGGLVFFDNVTNHIWRTSKVGILTNEGSYNVVWNSKKALQPILYPFYSQDYWESFLAKIL